MKIMPLLLTVVFGATLSCSAQYAWTWEELEPMPERISNNAVAAATMNGEMYVYSFGGIDSTKTLQGISGHSMRMSMTTESWEYIPDLPDTLGKIASAASTVNGIIYIIGGYHVLSVPPYEISSDRVHRFDPSNNAYLPDGAAVPVPIDDQVQAVWRDSLIYVITGWSQNQNVSDVQIYDPSLDEWSAGTSVPNSTLFKAFGASGSIIGDTIYYNGGAAGSSFSAFGQLRKGVIDPEDPTQITWTAEGVNPGAQGYRMAAVQVDDLALWIGGSGVTYNYDGIAYNGSGGVEPLARILTYDAVTSNWSEGVVQPYQVMDLRGAATVAPGQFVICGGMSPGQAVSDKAYLITYGGPSGIDEVESQSYSLLSNLIPVDGALEIKHMGHNDQEVKILDSQGRLLRHLTLASGTNAISLSDVGVHNSGTYFLRTEQQSLRFFVY